MHNISIIINIKDNLGFLETKLMKSAILKRARLSNLDQGNQCSLKIEKTRQEREKRDTIRSLMWTQYFCVVRTLEFSLKKQLL